MDESWVGLANNMELCASDFRIQLLYLDEFHAHVWDKILKKV